MSKGSSAFATIVGRLGRDPVHKTVGQSNVCNFSVAATSGWGQNEKTTWFDIAVWGKQADRCADMLHKGSKVLVHGEIGLRTWSGANGPGASITVNVGFSGYIEFLDSKDEAATNGGTRASKPREEEKPASGGGWGDADLDDDVPY